MRPSLFALCMLAVAAPTLAAPQVPLCEGLTVVTAVSEANGDYESIKTVVGVGESTGLKYSSEAPFRDIFSTSKEEIRKTLVYRTMPAADLRDATLYQQIFLDGSDELIPGTTSIGTSRAVLAALKSKGTAQLSISLAYSGVKLTAKRDVRPNAYDYFVTGKLERVGTVKVPLLVNDQHVELNAIHARTVFGSDKADFLFLDDEANPLTLRMRLGIDAIPAMARELAETCAGMRKANIDPRAIELSCRATPGTRSVLEVVKINYRCALPSPSQAGALEQSLQETGKADVYSIFFTFGSDALREESEPTLAEIAAILRKRPDWKLAINGHTDSVASDAYNLDLSKRRAASVLVALTTRYGISATRLSSAGFGESSPRDTNDTLEGRARNRRVELVRVP